MKFASCLVFLSLTAALLGLGSCSTASVQQECRAGIPALTQQIALGAQRISQETDLIIASQAHHGASRSLASVEATNEPNRNTSFELSDDQKKYWHDWITDRIAEIEHSSDSVRHYSEYSKAREHLSEATKGLVDFDGHIDRGRLYQMSDVLKKAEKDIEAAFDASCGAN